MPAVKTPIATTTFSGSADQDCCEENTIWEGNFLYP